MLHFYPNSKVNILSLTPGPKVIYTVSDNLATPLTIAYLASDPYFSLTDL